MNVLKDFSRFANIRGRLTSLTMLLIVLSILYCTTYLMILSISLRFGIAMYYGITYGFVLVAAYVYMIVIFMFIRNKRKDTRTLVMKDYIAPLLGVQTIFFVAMAGSSYLSVELFMHTSNRIWQYPLMALMVLFILFYIPMQIFACMFIYDGYKHPLHIIKQSFLTILRHHVSCFYILLLLVVFIAGYRMLLTLVFEYSSVFVVNRAVMEIMTHNNPFMIAFELGIELGGNIQLLGPVLVSLVYAIGMCIALVYFYSCMVCIYDKDIRV